MEQASYRLATAGTAASTYRGPVIWRSEDLVRIALPHDLSLLRMTAARLTATFSFQLKSQIHFIPATQRSSEVAKR